MYFRIMEFLEFLEKYALKVFPILPLITLPKMPWTPPLDTSVYSLGRSYNDIQSVIYKVYLNTSYGATLSVIDMLTYTRRLDRGQILFRNEIPNMAIWRYAN